MDKKLLLQYNDLLKERKSIKNRIEKIQKQSRTVSDVVQNGYKRHAVISGFDLIREKKLRELEVILMDREARIIIRQVEIEKYINTIEESKIRQIFEHRYIENMDWYQIAQIMNYNNEDAPRKMHDRFFEKNNKMSGHVRFKHVKMIIS